MTPEQMQLELAKIDSQIDALDRRRDTLVSQLRRRRAAEWIADEGVTRDQVQTADGDYFGTISRFAAWLRKTKCTKRFCEWNETLYFTSDVIAGTYRESPRGFMIFQNRDQPMTASVLINPGSGPVKDATETNAVENMRHFVTDCGRDDLRFVRVPAIDYGDGRFAFLLWRGERCHEIQMPGLPLPQVRFVGSDDQNIWNFPRLYVDGSSWVWMYAVLENDNDWNDDFASKE